MVEKKGERKNTNYSSWSDHSISLITDEGEYRNALSQKYPDNPSLKLVVDQLRARRRFVSRRSDRIVLGKR